MANLGLLTVASRYDVANLFIREIELALRQLGHKTLVIQSADDLLPLAHFQPGWIVSINGIALDLTVGGLPLPQAFGARHLSITVDNPLLFGHRWARASEGIVTVVDAAIGSKVKRRWPHLDVVYMPHGACGVRGPDPNSDRSIDVLVTGTYTPPAPQDFPPATQQWLQAQLALDSSPWHADSSSLADMVAQALAQDYLEQAVRYRRRTELLNRLTRDGIRVTLIGRGWEDHPKAAHHTLLGPKPFCEVIQFFGQSKVVMHVAASNDSHERPLTAMLQGAAVVVPSAPFWHRFFPACSLSASALLDYTESRCSLARSCQLAVASSHTWLERFQKFLMVGSRV